MSPEKQRIAIAEACGYLKVGKYFMSDQYDDFLEEHGPGIAVEHHNGTIMGQWHVNGYWCEPPDYLRNLNAMHEAINLVINTEELCEKFADVLRESVGVNGVVNGLLVGYWTNGVRLLNATSEQRAEAFLKAIDRWEP